jgi:peptidoglycan/LPS O-acetylase OafA/YrhL
VRRSKGIDILRAGAIFLVLGRHMGAGVATIFLVLGRQMEPVPGSSSSGVFSVAHWFSQLWLRGGWIGVDLFFVLSGFLVSGLLFREHQRFGSISAKDFLIRRGFKIYPAFWILIGATALWTLLHHDFHPVPIFSELFFIQNYAYGIWGHTWSLAVEEHFYILLLLLFLFLARRNLQNPFRSIPGIFCLIAVVSICLRIFVSSQTPFSPRTHLFPSHLRMDSLFFGVLISYYYCYHPSQFLSAAIRFRIPALALGVAALAPAFIFPVEATPFMSTIGLTSVYIGSGLILISFLAFHIPENKLVTSVAYIGSHSYSIYLWHVPLAIWGMPLLSRALGQHLNWGVYCISYFLGSVLFGITAALAIEFPFLRVRDRWFPSRAKPLEIASEEYRREVNIDLPADTVPSPHDSLTGPTAHDARAV